MKKWKYKVVRVKQPAFATDQTRTEIIEEQLNRLGMDGWELVSATQMSYLLRLYLKKEF